MSVCVEAKQPTYSVVLTDIRESCPRERSRWSRRTGRTAAATVPRPPSLSPDSGHSKTPSGRVCAPGESAQSPVRGFWRSRWGDFSPGARRFGVLTSTWHCENTEGGSETTKTSVTWRGSESRLWWTARSTNQRARLGWAGLKTLSDPMDCLTARAAFQYTHKASFTGCVPSFQARGTRFRLIYSFLCLFMCILASREDWI